MLLSCTSTSFDTFRPQGNQFTRQVLMNNKQQHFFSFAHLRNTVVNFSLAVNHFVSGWCFASWGKLWKYMQFINGSNLKYLLCWRTASRLLFMQLNHFLQSSDNTLYLPLKYVCETETYRQRNFRNLHRKTKTHTYFLLEHFFWKPCTDFSKYSFSTSFLKNPGLTEIFLGLSNLRNFRLSIQSFAWGTICQQ